ncbi:MAG: hypothetical protein ICV75_07205 [Nitrospiraceae bacterium]|nr:hypothetical protein [Nitrospiraceae bacterium]
MASFMPDPELEERRSLLQAAAGGSVPARLKLEREYHVRLYTADECARYAATRDSDSRPPARRKRNVLKR